MGLLRELVFENPMLIEVKRFWRRFFAVSKTKTANLVATAIACLAYFLLLFIALTNRRGFDGGVIIAIQTFLFCFLVPSMLHGAIAVEREKRTWDLLAVAPISKAQIVVGKFLSGLISILIVAALLGVLVLIGDNEGIRGSILGAELTSIGYAIFLAGLSILISSASNRGFTAQAGIYGMQVLGLIIWPMLAASMGGFRRDEEVLIYLHPFFAVHRCLNPQISYDVAGNATTYGTFNGIPHLLIYTFLAIVCLAWAVAKLRTEREAVTG